MYEVQIIGAGKDKPNSWCLFLFQVTGIPSFFVCLFLLKYVGCFVFFFNFLLESEEWREEERVKHQ